MTDDAQFWQRLRGALPRGIPGSDERAAGAQWQLPRELGSKWHRLPGLAPDKFLLGYGEDGEIIGSDDNRHMLLVAGTRAGKGVSYIIPNLLSYGTPEPGPGKGGSVLAIDPKGELSRLTRRTREQRIGQVCVTLDPFNASGHGGDNGEGFNPLMEIDARAESAMEQAALIADALIQVSPQAHEPYWSESARMFLRALILFVCDKYRDNPAQRHLGTVRDVLMLAHPMLAESQRRHLRDVETVDANGNVKVAKKQRTLEEVLYWLMASYEVRNIQPGVLVDASGREIDESSPYDRSTARTVNMLRGPDHHYYCPYAKVIEGIGKAYGDLGERERNNILSHARTETEWLDSLPLRRSLMRSSFRVADFKDGMAVELPDGTTARRNITVYLCLPARYLGYFNKWMRVVINLTLSGLEGEHNRPDIPVLLILDEMGTVLGFMKQLLVAAGLLAGSGCRIVSILQDLQQIKDAYGGKWETFVGNSGLLIFFGNADMTTLEFIASKIGKRMLIVERRSNLSRQQRDSGAPRIDEQVQHESLLTPSEAELVLARDERRALVMMTGERPLLLQRIVYHRDPLFVQQWVR